jgi:CheY-like chemotaxis protein
VDGFPVTVSSQSARGELLWSENGVRCLLVPFGPGSAVELWTERGSVFLRKQAPSSTAARNEAAYLRLLLRRDVQRPAAGTLKPFALIVEDERDTADAYREALRISGIRALSVHTGRDAIRCAGELEPDLVILDYRLPDVHGREVCRVIRNDASTAQIPILVVTASPQDAADPFCPDAVLTKPCLLSTLLAASRLLLRRVVPEPSQLPAPSSA